MFGIFHSRIVEVPLIWVSSLDAQPYILDQGVYGILRNISFWSEKCILQNCCFLANLLALKIKVFLRLLMYQTMYVPIKIYLSVTKSHVNTLLYLFRKVYVKHDIVYSIVVTMWLGTGFPSFIFCIHYDLPIRTI